MSILSLILPALTVVSLFLYILSAERAWLPKEGTTEWITRSVTPKRMTGDIKIDLKWKDIVIALVIVVVYGGLYSLYYNPFRYFEISSFEAFLCNCFFIGFIYIIAKGFFKNRVAALFAAAMTAATLITFATTHTLLEDIAFIIFILAILCCAEEIAAFIIAGVCLAYVANRFPITVLFSLLALCPAIMATKNRKNGLPILLWAIFCLVLPIIAILMRHATKISFSILPFTIQPVYDIVTAVCLIITIIHIFKDKSYTALFISVGLIISIICRAEGRNFMSVFTGLAIAYPANIIVQRGKKSHKVLCIIFGSVMISAFLAAVAHNVLKDYAPQFAYNIKDVFNYVFPFVTYY